MYIEVKAKWHIAFLPLRSTSKPTTMEFNRGSLWHSSNGASWIGGHPLPKRRSTCILNGRPGRQQLKTVPVW